ncbi:MAG: phosphoenolpyruvate synthase [Acidimicrobiia bacterium]|nr:phosphoenolpyruvate synthase [Acidimicrobiia bacterium]
MLVDALTRWFEDLTIDDIDSVGGKNASLGEMVRSLASEGIRVPDGFALTAAAYRRFLEDNGLRDLIASHMDDLDNGASLHEVGAAIRGAILDAELPSPLTEAIAESYRQLGERLGRADPDVAVRSSATAEDLPDASFAGQQDSYLNICGEEALVEACRRCYASLFTDRAISYRRDQGFDYFDVALSVGVQEMVRSDLASAGVMFTIDTDSGFPRAVLVDASWGLGESVVAGTVDPDEYLVFKPLLGRTELRPIISRRRGRKQSKVIYGNGGEDPTEVVDTDAEERAAQVLGDDEILTLARWAVSIEEHYGCAMDIEWAKDGRNGDLFIVQARPETVEAQRDQSVLRSYRLIEEGEPILSGMAVGDAIASGKVCKLDTPADIDRFESGAVLVTGTTDPDWEPIMKKASAIITEHGGRTSHAAIVSRELGLAAVVGVPDATTVLSDHQEVTVSCAEGERGDVFDGLLEFAEEAVDLSDLPDTRTDVMLNVGDPATAFRWWRLPADGVGLARLEFIVNSDIGLHPMAAAHPERLDDETRAQVAELVGDGDPAEYFVERLASATARVAAAFWPAPVIVRLSDFKTNEYARLLGGGGFEPHEENPMLGWRGASRYHHEGYRDGFALECAAMARVRDEMGLTNTVLMVPFCRTPAEADAVLEVLADNGLTRGVNGLEIYVMAEVPSNIILAPEFARRFDGFSIGSNDLTQLTLGVDRDSDMLASLFDESDPAVVASIESLITAAHEAGRKVGLCGQRPSNDPDFAEVLVRAGIDSISVTPDSFADVKRHVAQAEASAS